MILLRHVCKRYFSRLEMLPLWLQCWIYWSWEKCWMLLLSPRRACFSRRHEILVMLWEKNFWFYVFLEPGRLRKDWKVFYSIVIPSRVTHGFITSLLRHQWVHPDEAAEKSKQTARYDYHQTPDKIYCNVYCKGIIPKTTKVVMSSKRVDINVSIVVFYRKALV